MLTITIEDSEFFNDSTEEFVSVRGMELRLEHSLLSISKWEQILEKPFLPNSFSEEKTEEEQQFYVECMIIGKVPPKHVLDLLWAKYRDLIINYIAKPSTATTVQHRKGADNRPVTKIITSELVYYQMIALGIPVDFDQWHFNRLSALLEVFAAKNSSQKTPKADAMAQMNALNAQRLAAQKGG